MINREFVPISYDEISDGSHFEQLARAYFNELKVDLDHVRDIQVDKTGDGADGGIDIIVTYEYSDDIKLFTRKWIVQCKFHSKNISTNDINSVNIPALIHSKNANGYLLICKENPTSKLTNFFKDLNDNCLHGYKYQIWDGIEFIKKVSFKPNLFPVFFPKYNNSIK